jgi:hypothetical protein
MTKRTTREGFEYYNGDLVYKPENDGDIQVRDVDGNNLGLYRLGDDKEWSTLAALFGLTESDFPYCDKCDSVHRTGRHQ